ncbi:hypothetical protein Sp14A_09410 [Streptococcus pluranimalium]|uniref:DUF1433 domain-containing protein n=2 Tax=Streptococcus pluranimalium TaxID=82348 RepID=A0A345VJG0_9STRE|nr:hypothetical protein Sp14A_09410 [Streptococcus pluranimalium]
MFNRRENESKQSYKREQDQIVKYLSQNYRDIKKIEFTRIEKNVKTGYWNVDLTVNSTYYISISTVNFSDDIEVTDHIAKSKANELVLNKNDISEIKISEIKVIYFDEEE